MNKIVRNNKWLFIILTLGLVLRLYNINLPLLDAKPHREIHTAEETRNLYYQPRSFFYPTSKLWADEPGYYLVEFPIYNSLVAIFYIIFGSVNEVWGKFLSVIASVGVALFFYKLVTYHFGKSIAIWATAFMYLVSPQEIILSRSFQPDQLGFFFGLVSLYYFSLWIDTKDKTDYIVSWVALSLTLLIKISFFPFVFPMLYLVFIKFKKNGFTNRWFWLFSLTLVPVLIWFNHVRLVYLANPQLHSATLVDPSDWLVFQKLLDPHWYANIFYDFTEQVITIPVGLLALTAVFFKKFADSGFVYFWIIGVLMYALLFIGKIHFWYYQVPFLFPLTILAAITLTKIADTLAKQFKFPNLILTLFVLTVMITTAKPYLLRTYTISPRHKFVLETAAQVKKYAPANSKILASSHNSAALTYYALGPDMWGGTFLIDDPGCDNICIIAKFEAMRKWGVALYAVSDKQELKLNPQFEIYLQNHYPPLVETEGYVIFDLLNPRA